MSAGRSSWCVLDTAFGDGGNFLAYCQQRRDDSEPACPAPLCGLLPALPEKGWPDALAALCAGVGHGFHRLLLQDGQVSLTLCIGPLQAMLSELAMQADTVCMGASTEVWDKWAVKSLARLCHRGTPTVPSPAAVCHWKMDALGDAGFRTATDSEPPVAGAAPPSYIFTIRAGTSLPPAREIQHAGAGSPRCAVIRRRSGWHQRGPRAGRARLAGHGAGPPPRPAGGASGLPVGLVVPHVSADDSPRSRMSRSGTQLMLQHARHLLTAGEEWAPSGVREHRVTASSDVWHPMAGWIKPG